MSDTPELDRMLAVHEDSQIIGEFLEWATGAGGYHFTRSVKTGEVTLHGEEVTVEVPVGIADALADFYQIDLAKVETEQRALLARQPGAPKETS